MKRGISGPCGASDASCGGERTAPRRRRAGVPGHVRRPPIARRIAAVCTAAWTTLALGACGPTAGPDTPPEPPRRIVSMAPSVTETIFALGLGELVVGVTRYCDTPAAARDRASVGGFLDPDYEAIVGLEPDLVVLIQDHHEAEVRLTSLGLRTLRVDHSTVDGVLESIDAIADAAGEAGRGRELSTSIRGHLDEIALRVAHRPRPRTLVVVDRVPPTGVVRSVWAAGPGAYFDQVVALAGGVNALTATVAAYPELSREGLIGLDPDVILDIDTAIERGEVDEAAVHAAWAPLGELRAVRDGRLHVLGEGLMEVPGPRLGQAVELVARALHPDAWEDGP